MDTEPSNVPKGNTKIIFELAQQVSAMYDSNGEGGARLNTNFIKPETLFRLVVKVNFPHVDLSQLFTGGS